MSATDCECSTEIRFSFGNEPVRKPGNLLPRVSLPIDLRLCIPSGRIWMSCISPVLVSRGRGRSPFRSPFTLGDVDLFLAGMLAPPNLGREYTERFRTLFPKVAQDKGAVLIPCLLEGVAGERELNQEDRIHPNAEGHKRIARNVWSVLKPTLTP